MVLVQSQWNARKRLHEVSVSELDLTAREIWEVKVALLTELPAWSLISSNSHALVFRTDVSGRFNLGEYVARLKRVMPPNQGRFSYILPDNYKYFL